MVNIPTLIVCHLTIGCITKIKFIFVCACGKTEEWKYILNFSSELQKVGSYDFPQSWDGHQKSHLFLKQPLTWNDYDMPVIYIYIYAV
jgi:hypothetical protein